MAKYPVCLSLDKRAAQGGVSRSAGLSQNSKRRSRPPKFGLFIANLGHFFQKTAKFFDNGAFGADTDFLQVCDPLLGVPPPLGSSDIYITVLIRGIDQYGGLQKILKRGVIIQGRPSQAWEAKLCSNF